MKPRKTIGLLTFLHGSSNAADKMPGCSKLDHHYGGCQDSEDCKIETGRYCTYFEKVVLPTAADLGLLEDLTKKYAKQTLRIFATDQDRKCTERKCTERKCADRKCPDCMAAIPRRKRYCDMCKIRRRKQTYRNNRKRKKRNT